MSGGGPGADLALMTEAAREAGALALKRFRTTQKVWHKSKTHVACETDLEVDALLRARLGGARPDYGWLSEESEDDLSRLDAARVWVVDPIDGTNGYLKGIPEFAISIALVEGGRPIGAVVFNPAKDELFAAEAGAGATLNGAAMAVSATTDSRAARLLASRNEYRSAAWTKRIDAATVQAMSSIAYKLALVAAGRYDATATVWPKSDWDIAAGDLLVREAGGRFTAIDGARLRYNQAETQHADCLASNGALHAALAARLRELAA